MAKIHTLDPHVADLIAAGEVVERPASAVKELVENAIDAGSASVTVEIQNGGLTYIRITDDGCGMEPEDARTAFLRHATSKIRTGSDLAAIHTLGFRGEALAAISSVSRVDLLTKVRNLDEGTSLHLEGGVIESEQPVGCPDGTTIIIRDLFYNTPARMKFMKSDTAEASAVFSVVQQQALAHPEISFRFLKDGSELLHTGGDGELLSAAYAVLGRQAAMDMVPVDSHWEKISVTGFVSRPTATRGNRSYQHFFVNGRYVKSKTMAAALEEAYKNQIMVGRFPYCVLHVQLPAQAVDVNVHPAKTEVKFLSEHDIFDAVHYGVLASLHKTPGKPEMKLSGQEAPKAAPAVRNDFFRSMTSAEWKSHSLADGAGAAAAGTAARMPVPPPIPHESPRAVSVFPDDREAVLFADTKPEKAEAPMPKSVPAAAAPAAAAKVSAPKTSSPAPAASVVSDSPSEPETPVQQEIPLQSASYRIIGEVMDTYILVEQDRQLLFIDKHAAHERILFEKLKAQEQAVMPQMLMTPIPAGLNREESTAVLENAALLEKFGFGVEDFGDGSILIRQIPSDVAIADAESALSELAGNLLDGRGLDPSSLRDTLLHTIACKAAIKAGYHTEPAERDHLVREVLSREDLKYCPHGRPICTVLTEKQLEKQFKRA